MAYPTSLLVILQDPSEKDEEGDLESYLLLADDQQVVTVGSLTSSQQRDLQQLLQEFSDMAGEELGRTTAVQHETDVEGATPIRQQAYRLQEARRRLSRKSLTKCSPGYCGAISQPMGLPYSVGGKGW